MWNNSLLKTGSAPGAALQEAARQIPYALPPSAFPYTPHSPAPWRCPHPACLVVMMALIEIQNVFVNHGRFGNRPSAGSRKKASHPVRIVVLCAQISRCIFQFHATQPSTFLRPYLSPPDLNPAIFGLIVEIGPTPGNPKIAVSITCVYLGLSASPNNPF